MPNAERSGDLGRPARTLRRDAQRNRDAILAAARQVFCDHGLEAPLEEIARRAGVGIGTLYRRFPSRVQLLDAVLADTVQAHLDAAERALSPKSSTAPSTAGSYAPTSPWRISPMSAGPTPASCAPATLPAHPTPGGDTSASCWTAFAPTAPTRCHSHHWHPGRSTGPCSPLAAAPPGGVNAYENVIVADRGQVDIRE